MKCPECGFECLPDDVECLACGVNIVAAKENKEKEKLRNIEAAERKAQYEKELKKELGLEPSNDEAEKPVKKTTTLEETFRKVPKCPKCGFEIAEGGLECARCGIIFDKYKLNGNNITAPQSKPENPVNQSVPQKRPDISPNLSIDKTAKRHKADIPSAVPLNLQDKKSKKELSETISDHLNDPEASEKTQVFEPVASDTLKTPDVNTAEPVSETGADDKTEIISITNHCDEVFDIPEEESIKAGYKEKLKLSLKKAGEASIGYFGKTLTTIQELTGKLTEWYKSGGKKAKIISAGLAVALIVSILSPFIFKYYKVSKAERLKKEETLRIENIRTDFITNRDAISKRIKAVIDNKKFDEAEREIGKFDILPLEKELIPLKNYLKEIKLYEVVLKIPAKEYEKNYRMFLELSSLNPKKKFYKDKILYYKKKFAQNEYSKAISYFKHKKNNIDDLNLALASIEKTLDLFPSAKKYRVLDKKLKTNKLLFYMGNKNIQMAVRDDGMGKRLFSGQRKMTIWLRNTCSETIYVNVQYFTMVGKNKVNYTYNDIGRKFKSKLLPGEQTRGELFFRTKTKPAKVIFKHLTMGEISRAFP